MFLYGDVRLGLSRRPKRKKRVKKMDVDVVPHGHEPESRQVSSEDELWFAESPLEVERLLKSPHAKGDDVLQ